MISILVVDDHAVVRYAITKILSGKADMDVIDEAASAEDALALVRRGWCPDLVITDLEMPGMGGVEFIKRLLAICKGKGTRVLVLSSYSESPYPEQVFKAGASGFLTKESVEAEIIQAVRTVHAGKRYMGAEVAANLADAALSEDFDPIKRLSRREFEVLLLVAKGLTISDIAASLNITAKSVNTYRYRLYEKLNVKNDVGLTLTALRHRVIPYPGNNGDGPPSDPTNS